MQMVLVQQQDEDTNEQDRLMFVDCKSEDQYLYELDDESVNSQVDLEAQEKVQEEAEEESEEEEVMMMMMMLVVVEQEAMMFE